MTSCRAPPPTENKHLLSEKPEPLLKGKLWTRLPPNSTPLHHSSMACRMLSIVCTLGFSLATPKS